ncbi:ABC transporter ATP-binding protein [Arthrobacter sp. RIT-PI-e]|uniref:sugar ABC transporter ATP-binding protein n=1 Tax=Arthrobacter sp. RIT-PI-e TaxID=1681197 RepID=UPI000675D275|nr:sugar ABC transporter ATP-binding protein [Arthrobacter sp. RIT-PI-e]KNC17841.1 ABC transporter ATP-binding protein [Arthrobacter sp. RIT-PI-e]
MAVSVHGLTKRYGATLALDEVTLDIPDGQVHALLGHNGAGKSTIIKCLGGGTSPTSGTIELHGHTHHGLTPRESIAAGVAVIYQHLTVIDGLTVAENLFIGQERTRAGLIDRSGQRALARRALDRVGAHGIDPDMQVRALPIGQRQLVEIAKALQRDARLLILDEPTAALSREESDRLGNLVRDLADRGIAILYVTHLLGEVLKLADAATVLRNGRAVWHARGESITHEALVDAISDGQGADHERPAPPAANRTAALAVRGLGSPGLGPLDVTVAAGEIVACYGLIGSGRTRFLNTLFGRIRRTAGTVSVDGVPREADTPLAALKGGIALVPGDRAREGLFGTLPALDNTVVGVAPELGRFGFRARSRERSTFDAVARWLSLRPLSPTLPAGRFSGGNQQKILLGRWVNEVARTRVLLLDDPTQGVDIGARKDIYDAVKRLAAERGVGVLVATNESEEVVDLAHRCLIFERGRIIGEHVVADTTADKLLALVHSTHPDTRIIDPAEGSPL